MKKNTAQKDILYISISSCVIVVLWVGFNIYHAHVTSTIEPDLQLQIKPINPSFDSQFIQSLKSRQTIAPIFEVTNATSEAEISPTPIIINTSPTPETSPTPILEVPTPTDSTELIPPTESITE